MADEANAPATIDSSKPAEETTRPTDTPTEAAVAEEKPADGGDAALTGEASEGKLYYLYIMS